MAKRKDGPGFAPDWCVHFQSMAQHETCKAGIDYTALNGGTEYRRMHRLPCFLKSGVKSDPSVHCDHFKAPSAEEIALHEKSEEDRQSRLNVALAGVTPWRVQHQGSNHAEIIKCPVCRGSLHLSINAQNGRVMGECESAGCVSWKE